MARPRGIKKERMSVNIDAKLSKWVERHADRNYERNKSAVVEIALNRYREFMEAYK